MWCVGKRGEVELKEILNGGMKEAVSGKKDAHKAKCQINTEVNKKRHKSKKNTAKKTV